MSIKIAVIGAGVIGLCTAIQLLKKGYQVSIQTDQDPATTTSTVAGAIWMPFGVESDKLLDWSRDSLSVYKQLQDNLETGVVWRNHTEFFNTSIPKPYWMTLLTEGKPPTCRLPKDFACMYSVNLPNIDTTKYINYLLKTFRSLGGNLTKCRIANFEELKDFPIIINCTGFGAKNLTHDKNLYPIKGQRLSVQQPSEKITESIVYTNKDAITLIIPHIEHVVIGVSYIENDESLTYDMVEEKQQLIRAKELFPQLSDVKILERKVGIRPGRKNGVRLDSEITKDGRYIIHNYGHVGGGISLAPGCAENVVKLVENWVAR